MIPHLSGGGAEEVAKRWFQYLRERGCDVNFVLTHGDSSCNTLNAGFRTLSSAKGFIRKTLLLSKLLRGDRYDAVISLMPYANLLALLARGIVPSGVSPKIIISEHTIHSELNRKARTSHRIQWNMAKGLYRYASAAIAVSHPVAAELSSSCRIPNSKLWVLPNPVAEGIELRIARPSVASLSGGSLAIVVPSRLIAQKRLDLAVEAAALVARKTSLKVRVEFFGEGPEELSLRDFARARGVECHFNGWVRNWYEKIPEDGVVLLPSGVEGFGNVLVEAAARSVPAVVSSKALGVADACLPELTAKLVPGQTSSDYAAGILQAAEMAVPDVTAWLRRFEKQFASDSIIQLLRDMRLSGPPVGNLNAHEDESLKAVNSTHGNGKE